MAMQKTSIEKLSKVFNYLTENGASEMAQVITEIIRAESQTLKLGRFNIFDFAAKKDELHPTMETVFHENGSRIACDNYILCVSHDDYEPNLEGKMLRKDGSIMENGKYPNWRSVVPTNPLENGWKEYDINDLDFANRLSAVRSAYKAQHGKPKTWDNHWYIRIGGAPLRAEHAAKLLAVANHIGATKVLVKDSSYCVIVQSEKGMALLMPLGECGIDETFTEL